jgi:D-tyrosyl-tRNA(Tyr) deacylase
VAPGERLELSTCWGLQARHGRIGVHAEGESAMRTVVQRVSRASVSVEGEVVGDIGTGLLVLVGFAAGDGPGAMEWMSSKLQGLRIFPDSEGRMNLDVGEIGGEMLVVSQFTLYGDVSRGRRPSFVDAAAPEDARRLYDAFVDVCRRGIVPVATGVFGARMDVSLVNDGPVTMVIER